MSEQTFCKKHEIVLTLNWGCPYCRIEALERKYGLLEGQYKILYNKLEARSK